MLKGFDPLLSPDLLRVLRAMGHGDELAILDANYPAEAAGRPVLRLDGHPATAVLEAVPSVLPPDDFVPEAAFRTQVVGDPSAEQPIFAEFAALLARHEGRAAPSAASDGSRSPPARGAAPRSWPAASGGSTATSS